MADWPVITGWAGVNASVSTQAVATFTGSTFSDPLVWNEADAALDPASSYSLLSKFGISLPVSAPGIVTPLYGSDYQGFVAPRADLFTGVTGQSRATVSSTELVGAELFVTAYVQTGDIVPITGPLASFSRTFNVVRLPASSWSYRTSPPPIHFGPVSRADIDAGEVLATVTLAFTPTYPGGVGFGIHTSQVSATFDASWAGADDFRIFVDSPVLLSGMGGFGAGDIPGGWVVYFTGYVDLTQTAPNGLFWRYEPLPPTPGLGITPPLLARGRTARWFAANSEVVGNAPPMLARGRPW